mmetsp:Transcript_161187/g.517475  ORF Transcript_161187/g.517475 Transcript_161187/m.517475 type:complete len:371 (+) Transcript_161187:528-1640(+)
MSGNLPATGRLCARGAAPAAVGGAPAAAGQSLTAPELVPTSLEAARSLRHSSAETLWGGDSVRLLMGLTSSSIALLIALADAMECPSSADWRPPPTSGTASPTNTRLRFDSCCEASGDSVFVLSGLFNVSLPLCTSSKESPFNHGERSQIGLPPSLGMPESDDKASERAKEQRPPGVAHDARHVEVLPPSVAAVVAVVVQAEEDEARDEPRPLAGTMTPLTSGSSMVLALSSVNIEASSSFRAAAGAAFGAGGAPPSAEGAAEGRNTQLAWLRTMSTLDASDSGSSMVLALSSVNIEASSSFRAAACACAEGGGAPPSAGGAAEGRNTQLACLKTMSTLDACDSSKCTSSPRPVAGGESTPGVQECIPRA